MAVSRQSSMMSTTSSDMFLTEETCSKAPPKITTVMGVKQVMIVGDSSCVTAFQAGGFAINMNIILNGKADITVRSFPGYDTEHLNIITTCVAKNMAAAPNYIIVLLGNDDVMSRPGKPATTPEAFRKNFYSVINRISDTCDVIPEKLIICSPLPIQEMSFEGHEDNIEKGLENNTRRIRTFGEITAKVCKEFKATYVDMVELLDENLDGNFRPDGYNLSDKGHSVLAEKLSSLIQTDDSWWPAADEGPLDKDQLKAIAKVYSKQEADNIRGYTNAAMLDEYAAYMKKTIHGYK